MDPNETLREALQALSDLRHSHSEDDLMSAAIRFADLATWLESGGFPPNVVEDTAGNFHVGN